MAPEMIFWKSSKSETAAARTIVTSRTPAWTAGIKSSNDPTYAERSSTVSVHNAHRIELGGESCDVSGQVSLRRRQAPGDEVASCETKA